MTKATKKELDKDYSTAFQLYIQGAQSYLGLCATSKDEGQKTKWKSIASKALDRAEKLKKAHPNLTSVPKDPFAAGRLRSFPLTPISAEPIIYVFMV